MDLAQDMYERAIKADQNNAANLGNYASFLSVERGEHDRARELYERAVKADPGHANNLGNYAAFMLGQGLREQGLTMLDRAFAAFVEGRFPGLDVELWFYAYCHRPESQRAEALSRLKKLVLDERARSPRWDFSPNVRRASEDGHPEADWLPELAEVLRSEAEPDVLDAWPAWQAA